MRILASQPAGLQIDRQAALVGDIVQPVAELVAGNPGEGAVWLPDNLPKVDIQTLL
jgi:hypothetical protein